MTSQLQGWYKVWFAPKEVASYMTEHNNKLSIFLLLLTYGLALNLFFKGGEVLNSIMFYGVNTRLIVSLFISSIITGFVSILIYSIFLYSVSSLFNKSVVFGNGFIVYTWSLSPYLVFIVAFFALKIPAITLPLFLLCSLYSTVLLVFKISEINDISWSKAFIIITIMWLIQVGSAHLFGMRLY